MELLDIKGLGKMYTLTEKALPHTLQVKAFSWIFFNIKGLTQESQSTAVEHSEYVDKRAAKPTIDTSCRMRVT